MTRRLNANVFFVAVVAYATDGAAQGQAPSHVEILWQAPATCPTATWFIGRTEAFLGRSVEQAATRDIEATARVTASAAGFEAQVGWSNADGQEQRELSDPNCLVLADALAFIVASAIDPMVSYGSAEPLVQPTPPSSEEPTVPEPTPSAPVRPKPAPPLPEARSGRAEVSGLRFAFGPELQGRHGLLPETAILVGGVVELKIERLRAAAALAGSIPQRTDLSSGGGAHYWATVTSLRGCWLAVARRWELPLCIETELGLVRGRGSRVSVPDTAWLPWITMGPSVSLAFPFAEDLAGRIGTNVGFGVARPRFLLDGAPTREPSEVTGAVRGSVEWRFD